MLLSGSWLPLAAMSDLVEIEPSVIPIAEVFAEKNCFHGLFVGRFSMELTDN